MRIESIIARSIPDTRGRPTIETTLQAGAFRATASVPSGKSTGSHEAVELRDSDGSVGSAIENVNGEIMQALMIRDFNSADALDAFLIELDGTENKSRLGANALLSISIAAQRLFALEKACHSGEPLPSERATGKDFSKVCQVQRHPHMPSGMCGLSETLSKILSRRDSSTTLRKCDERWRAR